jgi:long-chain acyl-CoA synthetase
MTQQPTPLSAFSLWERQTPQRIFLRQPFSDGWKSWTYHEAGTEVRRIASALRALNIPRGASIAILSKNCAHWIMADLAIMMAGYVSVPVYPTLSAAGIREILQHSEAKLLFVGKLDDYSGQRSGVDPDLRRICFSYYGIDDGLRWSDLLDTHEPLTSVEAPDADAVASIMYSSGTTGTPKGVMLSFHCFGYVGEQVRQYLRVPEAQHFFSYLPLSHIAERALMEMVAIATGSTISFPESLEKFQDNLRHEQPTIFGGVPRIFAKFKEGVLTAMPQRRLDRLLAIPGLNILIRRMIVRKLGLSKASIVVCGAAATPVALMDWYSELGIEIRETYGMTENTAYSHSNFRLIRKGTVGQPWPGVDVRRDANGEILVRHPALMKGYFKDPAATAAVFTDDGFLRTGDKGDVDPQGFLTITGRMNDQFKTDKAKFVAPARLELTLSTATYIDQVCVVGAGLPQPIALVTLSSDGKENARESVEEEIAKAIGQTNQSAEKHEHIQVAVILRENWSIENGMMTPSLKIKRNAVEKRYRERYLEWFGRGERVIWE